MRNSPTASTARKIGLTFLFFILTFGNISYAQTGACCFDHGVCQVTTFAACAMATGTWMGEGTTCGDVDCYGACCLPDSSCANSYSKIQCGNAGGTFQGFGTTCGEVNCVPPEPAPTLTNWGLITLLFLILLTGIIVILRRRETA